MNLQVQRDKRKKTNKFKKWSEKKKKDKTPKTGKIKQLIWINCPIISNRLTIPIFKMS